MEQGILCEECRQRLEKHLTELPTAPVEIEGGTNHWLEEIEELRLVLRDILQTPVLDALLALHRLLNEEPCFSKRYAWFVRNSQFGAECRYAQAYLKKFKELRVDRAKILLRRCLEALDDQG